MIYHRKTPINRLNFASISAVAMLTALAASTSASAQLQTSEVVENEDGIDEIIVTVERRAQSLQDYAGTAAAISGEELKLLGIGNINELDGKIPGLSIANNQGNIEVYIRGVGSSNNTELGDPAAATHLNGVYVPRPSGFGAAFFDIERVEVNIGPQGTLRGRNATAGSVNIIPWAPGIGHKEFSAEASYGNFDDYRIEGVFNYPVTQNSAVRISAFAGGHDSYLNNISPNSSEIEGVDVPTSEEEGIGVAEETDDFGIRAAYLIEPTDNLKFTITGDYIEQKGTGYTGVNFAAPLGAGIDPDDIDDPRDVFGRGITPDEDTEHYGIKGQIDYKGKGFNVEYIGSYRDLVYDYEFTTPASPFFEGALEGFDPLTFDNFNRIRFITDSESIIQELRLFNQDQVLPNDWKVDWTVGGFYFNESQRSFLGTTGDRNPFFQGIEFNQTTDTESFSAYGDVTFHLPGDKARLTGGVRYTNDDKGRFGINAEYRFGFGGPDFNCCFANGVASGTEGFEFAALDREIIIPDTNGDGVVDAPESIAFLFDGIAQFGDRDGFDDIFPNGQQIQDVFPNAADRPSCDAFAFVGSCDNFVPDFNGVVDFSLAPFNSAFAVQNGRLENDFIDWRIRGEYDITDDNLIYALVSTGNKSGGFNDNVAGTGGLGISNPAQNAPIEFATDTIAPTYGPETLTLFEVGSKNEFSIGDVDAYLNVSGFFYDYDDLQLTTLLQVQSALDFSGLGDIEIPNGAGTGVFGFTFNASDAEIYGMQFEGGLKLPGDINLDTTVLWLPEARVVNSQEIQDSRFQADQEDFNLVNNFNNGEQFFAVNRSIEGNRLIRTPRLQVNGSISKAQKVATGTVDGVLSYGYRSSQNQTIFNGEMFEPNITEGFPDELLPAVAGIDAALNTDRLDDTVDGYFTLDAGVGYSHGDEGKWRIEAFVNNLTNIEEPQAIIITAFDNTRFFNPPRTYGVRLRAKFF